MPSVATEAFFSDPADEMCCGTIELSVPLRSGVIQIGVGGDVDVGRIRVSRSPWVMTVRRVDGRPIQVDVTTGESASSRVFDEPVDQLTLVRTDGRWRAAGSGRGPASAADLKRLADVIGTFAVAKQRRIQHSHRG